MYAQDGYTMRLREAMMEERQDPGRFNVVSMR
jgi:hypothetical protein